MSHPDINKWGRREGKALSLPRLTINREGMMELENHHFTAITVIDSAKNYQQILKLVGERLRRNRIFT